MVDMIGYLLGQIVYSIQESPDDEQYHFAHRMYVRTFRKQRLKGVRVTICDNERIELNVPLKFESSRDLKGFMDKYGEEILAERKHQLDERTAKVFNSEPLTYDSKLPFLGEYLPIREIAEGDARDVFVQDNAIYMKARLSDSGIRTALLKLCRNTAYEYMKPKVDYYSKLMGVEYSGLEIDDGRRTFGLFHDENKGIILSRRLMLMSESIIEFLVVHELAHSKSFQHGENHDIEMNKILPDHEERDEAFYETCRRLMEQGWI